MSQRPPSPDDQVQAAKEQQEHATTTTAATEAAVNSAPNLGELQSKEFVETAFEPDVNRSGVPGVDDNHIEERYSAEFSRHQGLGFISREDWEVERDMNRARAILAKQEYSRPSGLGSRCRGGLRKAWTGLDEPLPTLDPDLGREIVATFEERSMMQSLSIDGKGFRGLTEVTAVSRSEGERASGDDGGILSKVTGGLLS